MKESNKRLLGLVVTVACCTFILVGSVYAWFSANKKAEVSNINISIIDSYDLRCSFDTSDYVWNLSDDFDSRKFGQVSGDGFNFFVGVEGYSGSADKDGVESKEIIGYESLSKDDFADFLYFKDLYFKIDRPLFLYLRSGSSITPADKSERKNRFDFSRDYIAAAMRFSIGLVDDTTGDCIPLLIWAPNSKIEYKENSSSATINENGYVESYYRYVCGESKTDIKEIATNNNTGGLVEIEDGPNFYWGNIESNLLISQIQSGISHFYMSTWVEGLDRECVDELSGGQVSLEIEFTSSI